MYSPPILEWSPPSINVAQQFVFDMALITNNNGAASTVWPGANTAIIVPFLIPLQVAVQKVAIGNGATVSGNLDIGIYNESLAKLWTAGSTVQAGTGVAQNIAVSPILTLPRGRYYVALVLNNVVGTIRRYTGQAALGNANKYLGVTQMASAFPLPATLVPAASTFNYIPQVMLNLTATNV